MASVIKGDDMVVRAMEKSDSEREDAELVALHQAVTCEVSGTYWQGRVRWLCRGAGIAVHVQGVWYVGPLAGFVEQLRVAVTVAELTHGLRRVESWEVVRELVRWGRA